MNKEKLLKLQKIIDDQLMTYEDYDGDNNIDKSLSDLSSHIESFLED